MAMTTRCPQCGTAFRVVPDQLRVRNGLVRCGACDTVFDGRACLVAQIPQAAPAPPSAMPAAPVPVAVPAPAPAAPAAPVPPAVPPAPVPPAPVPPAAPAAPAPPSAPPVLSAVPAPPLSARPEPRLGAAPAAPPAVLRGRIDIRRHDPYVGRPDAEDEPGLHDDEPELRDDEPEFRNDQPDLRDDAPELYDDEPRAAAEPVVQGEARTRYYGATDVGRTPPEFLDTDRQNRRYLLRSLWGYGCVLGLLLLALQLVFVYRSAIAIAVPSLRPLLTSVCQPLGCQVGYARRIERIFITSSSLQPPRGQAGAPEQDDRSRLVLRVSLRNRYDKPQHWPALRLDLTDLSDTVVVRKVLRPEDYLPPGQAAGPFEAGAELNIEVPIEVAGAQVNGYQLDKFFP